MSLSREPSESIATTPRPDGSRRPLEDHHRQMWIAAGTAGLLAVMGLATEFLIWPDWDSAWLLSVARMMKAGATLYSNDVIEVNPPAIVEYARLALTVSDLTGLAAVTVWRLLAFASILISLGLSLPILRSTLKGDDADLFLPASVLMAAVLGCLPGANFGQREHLIVLLTVPYVLAAALYVNNERLALAPRLVYGALLAVALNVKPQFALLVLCVEGGVVLLLRQPRACVRVETVSALVTALVVALLMTFRYPGYLSFVVPLALRFYGDFGELRLLPSHVAYLVGCTVAVLTLRQAGPRSTVPRLLLLAGVGSFLTFLVQRKGWDYQFVPAQSYLILAGALAVLLLGNAVAARWAFRRSTASGRRVAVPVAVAMMLAVSVLMARRTVNINRGHWAGQFSQLQALLGRAQPPGRRPTMTTLSVDMFPAFPVIEVMGGEWSSRFAGLWMIPAIEAREREGGDAATPENSGRRYLTTAVTEDLVRRQPTFVLIEEGRSRVLDDIVSAQVVQDQLRAYHRVGGVGAIQVWVRDSGGPVRPEQVSPSPRRHPSS